MKNDETLEKLVYEFQILRGFTENIQQRVNIINAAITELRLANLTLEGISKEKLNCSILVPIGGGSYIRARLEDTEKLIVGIGSDVSMEKTIGEAKETFQARILELENVKTSLQKQINEASTKIDVLQREIQKITQQTNGESKDVRGF